MNNNEQHFVREPPKGSMITRRTYGVVITTGAEKFFVSLINTKGHIDDMVEIPAQDMKRCKITRRGDLFKHHCVLTKDDQELILLRLVRDKKTTETIHSAMKRGGILKQSISTAN